MMKFKNFLTIILLSIFALVPAAVQAQRFSDINVEYSFEIPEDKWKITVKPSASNKSLEMVYVDRNDGHFEVRRLSSPRATLMADIIRDEETKLQFSPGFVPGKEENFSGKLRGTVYNYEYIRAGRPMAGRFYFLRQDDSVYVLRFTGFRDKLRSIRNQTDIIARTFEISKS